MRGATGEQGRFEAEAVRGCGKAGPAEWLQIAEFSAIFRS